MGNARIAGIADEVGSIEPGKQADFIVTERNPLDDLANLRRLAMVARDGNIMRKPQIKPLPDVDEALDACDAEILRG